MDELECLLAAMAADGWGDRTIGDRAAELRRQLGQLAVDGAAWAIVRLAKFEQEGARAFLKAWEDRRQKQWLGPDGRKLTTSAAYAVPAENERTGARVQGQREAQLPMMTWTQIEVKRASIATLRTRLDDVIRVLDMLEALREKYPQATCPYEAMLMDGIDPNEAVINLSKVV